MKSIVVAFVVTVIVAVGLAVGGWQLGWWLKSASVNRNNQIAHQSYNYQTAQITDMQQVMSQIANLDTQEQANPSEAPGLDSQKLALETQFCGDYTQITNGNLLTGPIRSFASELNCSSTPKP